MMQIFLNPYKTLHTKSTPFDFSNDSIMHYQDLEKFEYDFANFMKNSKGIGLAANQIGLTKRFFCMGYESFDKMQKPVIMWNPSIVRESKEMTVDTEGCLSFPGVFVKVLRPEKVSVRWENLKGETLMQHLEGYEAKCFQHELDHIDGITFDRRVSKLKWDMAKKKAEKIK
jgi:peptide deformylase